MVARENGVVAGDCDGGAAAAAVADGGDDEDFVVAVLVADADAAVDVSAIGQSVSKDMVASSVGPQCLQRFLAYNSRYWH